MKIKNLKIGFFSILFMYSLLIFSEVYSGEIVSVSSPEFIAGKGGLVSVLVHAKSGSGDVFIQCISKPAGWSVSPDEPNPDIDTYGYYRQLFTVTPPANGGSGTLKWAFYNDGWGIHPSGSTLLDTWDQEACTVANRDPSPPGQAKNFDIYGSWVGLKWAPSTDPDGDEITYEVYYSKTGLFNTWISDGTTQECGKYLRTVLELGCHYRIKIVARDGKGGEAISTNQDAFTISSNHYSPELLITKPASDITISNTQTECHFSGSAYSSTGYVVGILFRVNSGDWKKAGAADTWDFIARNLQEGDNYIQVKVLDDDGSYSSSVTRKITLVDSANIETCAGNWSVFE